MNERIAQNETVTLQGRWFPDGKPLSIEISDGLIARIEQAEPAEPPAVQRWLVPGFFDIQVNGFGGGSFVEPELTVEEVTRIARAVLRTGVTRFLPTIVTAEMDTMAHQLATIAEAMEQDPLVAHMCPGMHVEGPFIHPDDGPRGAHPKPCVRPPNIPDFDRLWQAARQKIRILSLAPDQPGAVELIREAGDRGVITATAHHRAEPEQLEAAIDAGIRLATHLGNGCDATMPRLDNVIWRQLADDRLWASFITDGQHLPRSTAKCMLRTKTPQRAVLITDAISVAGLPPGQYTFGRTPVELLPSGRVVLTGTPYQAGSSASIPHVLAEAIRSGGVDFAEAIGLVTCQPRSLLGMEPPTTDPVTGQPANLVEIDWHIENRRIDVRQTVAGLFSTD